MRRAALALIALLLFLGLLAGLPAGNPQSGPSLSGRWEGQVLDPRRPVRMLVAFYPAENGGWQGTIDIFGQSGIHLEDLQVTANRILFRVPFAGNRIPVEAEIRGDAIRGKITLRRGPTDLELSRAVQLPAPKNRTEEWQQDLDVALSFEKYDRGFTPAAREKYKQEIVRLRAAVGRLDDYQLTAGLARAVALAANAHSVLGYFRSKFPIRRFPARLYWFRDGLFVVRAAPENRAAVGCRVTALGGRSPEEMNRRVAEVFSGNESWVRFRAPAFFVMPELLYGLGVIPSAESMDLDLRCPSGGPSKVTLRAAAGFGDQGGDAPSQLVPPSSAGAGEWVAALKANGAASPRYLSRPQANYWFEFQPDAGILYFQFNRSLNEGGGETLPVFGERLLGALAEERVRAVVVDLRFNNGGNLDIARDFIARLRDHEKLKAPNRLFVITGRATFSAAIFHAAQLRENPNAVFVGEPVGDHLEFWAEGDAIALPNSGLVLRYSNGYHSYSRLDPPEFRPYYMDLGIATLDPDIRVTSTFAEFAAGRDVAMEAIRQRLR